MSEKIKILYFSDLHADLTSKSPTIPDNIDLILIAGDIADSFDSGFHILKNG